VPAARSESPYEAVGSSGGARVGYANPVDAFIGHGGCDDHEWINKIVIGPAETATSTTETQPHSQPPASG
jgi:hypothetical protein